jgi:hypothetical protein
MLLWLTHAPYAFINSHPELETHAVRVCMRKKSYYLAGFILQSYISFDRKRKIVWLKAFEVYFCHLSKMGIDTRSCCDQNVFRDQVEHHGIFLRFLKTRILDSDVIKWKSEPSI